MIKNKPCFHIDFTDSAKKDLRKLNPQIQKKIQKFLNEKLLNFPSPKSIGEPLKENLKGIWRYRVGDYRILCEIKNNCLLVLVVEVGHRKNVYVVKH